MKVAVIRNDNKPYHEFIRTSSSTSYELCIATGHYSCGLSTETIEYSSLSVCLPVCVSVCLSVLVSVCLSVCLSVYTITEKIMVQLT